jgi:hypothetical protein
MLPDYRSYGRGSLSFFGRISAFTVLHSRTNARDGRLYSTKDKMGLVFGCTCGNIQTAQAEYRRHYLSE